MWSLRSKVATIAFVATVSAALTVVYFTYRRSEAAGTSSLERPLTKSALKEEDHDEKEDKSVNEANGKSTTSTKRTENNAIESEQDKSVISNVQLRLCDAASPTSVTIWHAAWTTRSDEGNSRGWPVQFGQCLENQLLAANKKIHVQKKSLATEPPESIFANYGGMDQLNLLILPSDSEGQTAMACRRLQNWLRAYIARRDNDDGPTADDDNIDKRMSQFLFQVLGVDVDANQDGALVYCSVAIEIDRLLAVAGCKRFASMYTLTSNMSSRRGYVLSLLDTLGASQPHTDNPTKSLYAGRQPVGLFYASWSCVSKTFAYELREILKDFLQPPLDAVDVRCMGTLTIDDLVNKYDTAVFLVSSYTFGDPPPAVMNFWRELCEDREAGRERLSSFSFGILGLGDTTYFADSFCKAAYDLETLLMACGACRILPLATCDQMLGQQPIQFRLWATTILGPSLKRHVSEPSKLHQPPHESSIHEQALTQIPGRTSETEAIMSSTDSDAISPLTKKLVLILYGTQSGTSESYARELEKRINKDIDVAVHCSDIEDFEVNHWTHPKPSLLVFVVSTYGDGDPPESCQKFYKRLIEEDEKLEAFLQGIPYCIVALGNSAYASYCGFGSKLNRALKSVTRSTRKLPMLKLDENVDREPIFDRWWHESFRKMAIDTFGARTAEGSKEKASTEEVANQPQLLPDGVHFKLVPCQRKHDTTPAQHICHQPLQVTVPSTALSKDIYKSSIQFEIVDCRLLGAGTVASA